jgi:ketosteroid isomerase-like protein
MRSITVLACLSLTAFALAACGDDAPPPQTATNPAPTDTTPPPATTTAPVDTTPPPPAKPDLATLMPQTMKGIGDAFNAHDPAKMTSFFTPDAVVSAYGMPDMKAADMATGMKAWFAAFPHVTSGANRIWTKGNVAVIEMTWAGPMEGDFMGMKATNKPVGAQRVHVMWFTDDGLVKEMHEYGDDAGTMAQMKGDKKAPPVPTVPTNPPEMHSAKNTPDEDKLASWTKGLDDAFNKDDVKAVMPGFADDADFWLNIGGPAVKGTKDMTKGLTDWFKTFPDQKWTPVNAWGIDGYAIIEHTMTGTQKGPMGPIKASNKQVQNWHWLEIQQPTADGKVQHDWAYANLVEMLTQTGVIKPMGTDMGSKPGGSAPPPPPAPSGKLK